MTKGLRVYDGLNLEDPGPFHSYTGPVGGLWTVPTV